MTYIIISPVVNRVALVTSRVARIMTLFVYELATLQSQPGQKWKVHGVARTRFFLAAGLESSRLQAWPGC